MHIIPANVKAVTVFLKVFLILRHFEPLCVPTVKGQSRDSPAEDRRARTVVRA